MSTRTALTACVACAGFLAGLGGCVQPGRPHATVLQAYQEHLVRQGAPPRRDMAGLGLLQPARPAPGDDLKIETVVAPDGSQRSVLRLELDDAIRLALSNSADIHVVSYDPPISRQEMIKAAAEFDAVLLASARYDDSDKRPSSIFGGGHVETRSYSVGLQQKVPTGGTWSLAWTMTRTWDNGAFSSIPTRYEPTLNLEITQPLLRDAWPQFNLARLRIARIGYDMSLSTFRDKVEDIVAQVVGSYWLLVQSRRDLEIQEKLLAETLETRRKVSARVKEGLAPPLQEDQIIAAVESRRASLAPARKLMIDAQDRLARLLNDPRVNLLSGLDIVPTDPLADAIVIQDVEDQLLTALAHNPALEHARLAIQAEAVNVLVARNQALPRLDLKATAGLHGLAGTRHESKEKFLTGNYLSYGASLDFEYPLGNRARLADVRAAHLSRAKAVVAMQNVADQVALAVRERLRQVQASFEQIQAFDEAVKSATAYRDKLEVTVSQELGKAMNPERLQLLLGAQELVASLERSRLQAVTSYNTALADLARAKGTVLEMNRVRVAIPVAPPEQVEPAGD